MNQNQMESIVILLVLLFYVAFLSMCFALKEIYHLCVQLAASCVCPCLSMEAKRGLWDLLV